MAVIGTSRVGRRPRRGPARRAGRSRSPRGSGRSGRTGWRAARWWPAAGARATRPAPPRAAGGAASAGACPGRGSPAPRARRSSRPSPSGVSSSNIASSPKMSPGPKVASAIWRPSACSRTARAWPRADDVTRVGLVALAEHDLARRRSAAGGRPRPPARGPRPPAARTPARGSAARPFLVCSPSLRRGLPLRSDEHTSTALRRSERPLAPAARRTRPAERREDGQDRPPGAGPRAAISEHAGDHLEHAAGVAERVARRPAVAGVGGRAGAAVALDREVDGGVGDLAAPSWLTSRWRG